MSSIKEFIQTRDAYIALVKTELLGPGSELSIPDAEHELITTAPHKRYSIGILYPQGKCINAENSESMRYGEADTEEALQEAAEDDDSGEIVIDEPTRIEAQARKLQGNGDAMDDESHLDEDDNLDEEIGLTAQQLPSSMGITFIANRRTDHIHGHLSFAMYRRAKLSDCRFPYTPPGDPSLYIVPPEVSHLLAFDKDSGTLVLRSQIEKKKIKAIFERDTLPDLEAKPLMNAAYRLCEQLHLGFVRIPHEADFELDFTSGDYFVSGTIIDEVPIRITALRRILKDNSCFVTVMLVNTAFGDPNGTNCILQPNIMVCSEGNGFGFTQTTPQMASDGEDDEEQSLTLLYRDKKVYASGLGTSAKWQVDSEGKGYVSSDFFPESEVPSMDFNLPCERSVANKLLSMKRLSDLVTDSQQEKLDDLRKVVAMYEHWIDDLSKRCSVLDAQLRPAAERNIAECRKAAARMTNGLNILRTNENAWKAFLLANRAMYIQREQLALQDLTKNINRYPGDDELGEMLRGTNYLTAPDKHIWRPFQMAFILMDIASIVNDTSPERNLVDLIWFPTGGGKTEAYLGLTAFTIFYRRLTHPQESGGTAVMMRYTLRLLAAQQFTRAATLICACETMRKDGISRRPKYPAYRLGDEEITIGLWIGSEHTPNSNETAKSKLSKLTDATALNIRYRSDRYNKFQVLKCPWCGTKLIREAHKGRLLGQWGYQFKNKKHFYLHCPHEDCEFTLRLPIQIVDEELYEHPPTLLFGTVDKFAMLPWDSRVGRFFAAGCANRAPELIIQDELHLISGPLGTMVGLYETIVDFLCQAKGVKPKVIASTATIRRAKEQCSVLYNRDVVQFPAPGLDADDSFFARESPVSYEDGSFGRKYVGLMPSGKTKAMMEVRSLQSLLQHIHRMQLSDDIKDKYWTLTAYFNSLKDLGKCSTLLEDDVKDFIRRMAYRLGSQRDSRLFVGADELTSRVSTTELNETLDKLEKVEYSADNIANKRYASNVLLATNMISVGIDVARLNVMLLVGQPKLTSEYIQASSRVGRRYPGVAFAMYDGSKSRDRSHYEQFRAFHESFYRYVEPTGATPFSQPARDRALHAVVTAMLRYDIPLSEDKDAIRFDHIKEKDRIEKIKEFIVHRIQEVNARATYPIDDEAASAADEIDAFLEAWSRLAKNTPIGELSFGRSFMVKPPGAQERRLLKAFGTAKHETSSFPTLTSMRNVDSTVAGNVLVWEVR